MKKFLAGVSVVALLAACAAQAYNQQSVAFYAEDIENGLSAILASPTIQADLTPAQFVQMTAALGKVEATTKLLEVASGQITQATALGYVQEIESDTNTIIAIASTAKGLSPEAVTVMTAIQVIEPIILASVQAGLATNTPPAQAKATLSGMTPDQAANILSAKPVVP